MMRYLQRAWSFFYERQWAIGIGVVSVILMSVNEALDLVSTEVEAAGTDFNLLTLLVIAQAIATRWNVWSAKTVAAISTGGDSSLPVGD